MDKSKPLMCSTHTDTVGSVKSGVDVALFMDSDKSKITGILLAATRIVLGWMMLWGFLDKMFGLGFQTPHGQGLIDGVSPSSSVVYCTSGIFADMWNSVAGNPVADFFLMVGLLLIGIALILGIAKKITCISSTIFFLCMYSLSVPPTDNPILDYHITWILLIWILYLLGGFEKYSLYSRYKDLGIVRKFRILE